MLVFIGRIHVWLLPSVVLILLGSGCSSSGLSPRETQQNNITTLTYSLYNKTDGPRPVLKFPQALAVVQMGEVAPPSEFMDGLKNTMPFIRIEALPAPNGASSEADVQQMEQLARSHGNASLLVVGGTIDVTETSNALAVLDLTVIGLFVFPSRTIDADVKASGVLIDLATGRSAQIFTTEARKSGVSSAASSDDARKNIFSDLRATVSKQLAKEVVDGCVAMMNGKQ